MKKGDVVVRGLVPAHQNAPKAVHPTVSALHHPTPGFESGLPFDSLGLFAPAPDVGREAELFQGPAHLIKVVTLVQAQTLRMLRSRRRSLHREAVHRGPHQLHVVAVGPIHRQPHRNAPGLGQQAALDPGLAPVGRVGTGFSPRPRGTWSWPRSYSANSSPDPSIHRNVPTPSAIVPGTPRRRPIPESADGPWSRSKCRWHPRPSTGSRCAARRRYRWRRSGPAPGAGLRPGDGCSPAGESGGPVPPKVRRTPDRSRWWGWPERPGRHDSVEAVWVLSLWSFP